MAIMTYIISRKKKENMMAHQQIRWQCDVKAGDKFSGNEL